MRIRAGCALLLVLVLAPWLSAQQQMKPAALSPDKIDVDDLLADTQQTVKGKGYTGMVWWVPVEFWQASSPDTKAEDLAALRDYTMVLAVIGKVGAFGAVSFASAADLRSATVLRAADGTEYPPVQKASPGAEMLATVIKPMLKNLLGTMGESVEVLYFPAKTKAGKPIADPAANGAFSVVLRNFGDEKERLFEWKTPLNSVVPPRYCPTGKERVQANWKYCPWHGTKLD